MPPKKNSFKKDKLEERILQELNSLLRTKLGDARLQFVSITKVEINEDYSVAKVFWDTFQTDKRGDANEAMKSAKSRMRNTLAQTLDLRVVPQIVLQYDAQFESEKVILDILKDEEKKGRGFK